MSQKARRAYFKNMSRFVRHKASCEAAIMQLEPSLSANVFCSRAGLGSHNAVVAQPKHVRFLHMRGAGSNRTKHLPSSERAKCLTSPALAYAGFAYARGWGRRSEIRFKFNRNYHQATTITSCYRSKIEEYCRL